MSDMRKSGTAKRSARKLGVFQKGQKTRDKILRNAALIFSQHGYRGTSLELIASASGVTRSVPYLYFENKRHMFISCVDYSLTDVKQLLVPGNISGDPHIDLKEHLERFIEFAMNNPLYRRLSLRAILEDDREFIDIWTKSISRSVRGMETMIKRANPYVDAHALAILTLMTITFYSEIRKFEDFLNTQPNNLNDTSGLLEYLLSMIYRKG